MISNLYYNLDLKTISLLKQDILDYSKTYSNNQLTNSYNIPKNLQPAIQEEFNNYGFGEISNVLIFKRFYKHKGYFMTHIDDKNISIVLPITGCENTAQYWYTGEYTTLYQYIMKGYGFHRLIWKSPGYFLNEVEIINNPVLCNVSVPHGAYGNGIITRITASIRFKENPTYEEALSRFLC